MSASSSSVEGPTDGQAIGDLSHIDFERIQHKLDNLPTREKLFQEEDPNAYTEEELLEAARFVVDLLATSPQNDSEIESAQRKLRKKHKKVFKKSLLLAAYRHLLDVGVPASSRDGAEEGAPQLSKRQMRRLQRQQRAEEERSGSVPVEEEPKENGEAGNAPPVEQVRDVEDLCPRAAVAVEQAAARVPLSPSPALERYLISKAPRSQSGVLVVTVFTSPYPDGQTFSCEWNCYYCPNEPNQPRSYLLNEPGVRRANRLDFDPYRQFAERVQSLAAIGHPADKVELLVLGGTWESYPAAYRTRFIRDLFYAANTIFDDEEAVIAAAPSTDAVSWTGVSMYRRRPPLDLLQEQLLNEHAKCKIIGVTLETRPDTVNAAMLRELRRFGCTRVQLGVQHTDDAILTKVNRQSTREDAMQAIKLLKDSCFKVDIHLMPDLPGATPDIDKAMFDDVMGSPYLQADQWKIYPCQTTPFTVIEQWHRDGRYVPYGLENLVDVLLYAKLRVQPWIRLNRVIRDIPVDYVLAGVEVANLRQLLAVRLQKEGRWCNCIRCREVKGDRDVARKLASAELVERTYEASEGTETFLSFETPDRATIFAFLRLRTAVRNAECPFPELDGCALIRELHVYGSLVPTYGAGRDTDDKAQHTGLGGRLLRRAEELARDAGYSRIAVISGVGVRGYYRRHGYRLHAAHCGGYLIKDFAANGTGDAAGEAAGRVNPYMAFANATASADGGIGEGQQRPAAEGGRWGVVGDVWRGLWSRWATRGKRPREE